MFGWIPSFKPRECVANSYMVINMGHCSPPLTSENFDTQFWSLTASEAGEYTLVMLSYFRSVGRLGSTDENTIATLCGDLLACEN